MGDEIQIWRLPATSDAGIENVHGFSGIKTLDQATSRLPGGGYTTFRTFEKYRVLRISDHYQRLEETAVLAGRPLTIDRRRLSGAIHQALAACPAKELRVRLILDLEQGIGDIYIMMEILHTPEENKYRDGVYVLTRSMHRQNPKAKLTGFLEAAAAVRHEMPEGVEEVLMVGEDARILEGLSSNFFAVRGGVIYTAEEGVLSGITRLIVIDEIQDCGLPFIREGLPIIDACNIEEAFITSASRAVLPVTSIDGKPVGDGKPGVITRLLQTRYHLRIERELDTL